jgi:hypothetical protein
VEAKGYAECRECGGTYRAYAPRKWKVGDDLHVWSHTHDRMELGWGRQPKCSGSYKVGRNTRLFTERT